MISNLPWSMDDTILNSCNSADLQCCMQRDWTLVKVEDAFKKDNHSHTCTGSVSSGDPSLPLLGLNWKLEIRAKRPTFTNYGVLWRESDIIPAFCFDHQPNLQESCGPSPSLLLQALTMSNSNDVINLGKIDVCSSALQASLCSEMIL